MCGILVMMLLSAFLVHVGRVIQEERDSRRDFRRRLEQLADDDEF